MATDTPTLLRVVRRYIRQNYPGAEGETITIRLRSGDFIRLPIIGNFPACKTGGAAEKLQENELHILGFIPAHDKEPMSSAKLAKACGYKHNSYFSKLLRRLRNKGQIVLDTGGYRKAK